MRFDNIEPDRWHDRVGSGDRRLQQQYGTPGSWYRRSLWPRGTAEFDTPSRRRDEQFIRVAAVFDRATDIRSLDGPWTLFIWPRVGYTCSTKRNWVIVLASVEDQAAWLKKAYDLGARVWYRSDSTVPVWTFEPVEHNTDPEFVRADRTKKIKYDRERLVADLQSNYLSHSELADRYGISRSMVHRVAQRLRQNPNSVPRVKPVTQIQQILSGIDQTALEQDIAADQNTKSQLAKKYNIPIYAVTVVQKRLGLIGKLTYHKRLARGISGGRPQKYDYNEDQLVADMRRAQEQGWTKEDVADRHNIPLSTLAGLQQKHSVYGTFAVRKRPRVKKPAQEDQITQKSQ